MNFRRLSGVVAVIVGAAVVAAAFSGAGAANANGISCSGPTSPTPTSDPTVIFGAAAVQIPTCSPTPTARVKTHTPTASPTAEDTQVPPTVAPTNTPVPPTKTPSGGNEGLSVKPPNTGTGDGASGGVNIWLVAAGAALATVGGGSVLAGMRRRR